MAPSVINILLTSFPGLGLPSTLCIPVSRDSAISDLIYSLSDKLPSTLSSQLYLSTPSGSILRPGSADLISSLLSAENQASPSLPVRLSAPLCGGKGGFGSQLRAAGGRMSSRKKRANGENSGSNRNLDGRRLRTVNEAKALAEYLAVKPDMDRKEKEEKRKRWEQVVEAADRKEEEIKSGKGKAKVDGAWLEEKEEGESKVRDAVVAAMRNGMLRDQVSSRNPADEENDESSRSESSSGSDEANDSDSEATTPPSESNRHQAAPRLYGWDDEEDEEDSEDEDDEDENAIDNETQ